jgi:hypothetical protein
MNVKEMNSNLATVVLAVEEVNILNNALFAARINPDCGIEDTDTARSLEKDLVVLNEFMTDGQLCNHVLSRAVKLLDSHSKGDGKDVRS